MKRTLWLLMGLALPALGFAASTPIQASMVVTGTITVNPDGSVNTYTIHDADKLPPAARQIVQAAVPHWEFAPVLAHGKAVTAETGMALRIVADQTDDQRATVRVASATFGCEARAKSHLPGECPAGTAVTPIQRSPPKYPLKALRSAVGGEVFLVVDVDRTGHVIRAASRQVNLYTRTPFSTLYRKVLADSAQAAALKWEFRPPIVGPEASKGHWTVLVPIRYMIGAGPNRDKYGKWNSYIPGPTHVISWDGDGRPRAAHGQADAVAGNAPFVRDARFVLKTQLGAGEAHS